MTSKLLVQSRKQVPVPATRIPITHWAVSEYRNPLILRLDVAAHAILFYCKASCGDASEYSNPLYGEIARLSDRYYDLGKHPTGLANLFTKQFKFPTSSRTPSSTGGALLTVRQRAQPVSISDVPEGHAALSKTGVVLLRLDGGHVVGFTNNYAVMCNVSNFSERYLDIGELTIVFAGLSSLLGN